MLVIPFLKLFVKICNFTKHKFLSFPATKIIMINSTSTDETDNRPSTFWITNPKNEFIGNVAAGSGDSGYCLQLM